MYYLSFISFVEKKKKIVTGKFNIQVKKYLKIEFFNNKITLLYFWFFKLCNAFWKLPDFALAFPDGWTPCTVYARIYVK
jgi:hypothetical protein